MIGLIRFMTVSITGIIASLPQVSSVMSVFFLLLLLCFVAIIIAIVTIIAICFCFDAGYDNCEASYRPVLLPWLTIVDMNLIIIFTTLIVIIIISVSHW